MVGMSVGRGVFGNASEATGNTAFWHSADDEALFGEQAHFKTSTYNLLALPSIDGACQLATIVALSGLQPAVCSLPSRASIHDTHEQVLYCHFY